MNKLLRAIREILSENGVLSSKRVCAVLMVLTACLVDILLAVKFGCCDGVVTITCTLIISACALLGIMVFGAKGNANIVKDLTGGKKDDEAE